MTRCPRAGETGRIMGKRGRILVTTENITPHSPQHATIKSAVRRAPEDGNAAASSQTAVAFSAEEAKRERKRLKKKRQKERQKLEAAGGAGAAPAGIGGGSTAAAVSALDGDLDDIFGSRAPPAARSAGAGAGASAGAGDEDEDDFFGPGDIVPQDMDELEAIFSEKTASSKAAKSKNAADPHSAAGAPDGDNEWNYTSGNGKARRKIDDLDVYTEDENKVIGLAEVKGKLDGPCPFDCSCCF